VSAPLPAHRAGAFDVSRTMRRGRPQRPRSASRRSPAAAMRSPMARRSILATHAMTATITLGMRAGQVEAVRNADDLDGGRAQLLQGDDRIRHLVPGRHDHRHRHVKGGAIKRCGHFFDTRRGVLRSREAVRPLYPDPRNREG
jgi:hypothetical protein